MKKTLYLSALIVSAFAMLSTAGVQRLSFGSSKANQTITNILSVVSSIDGCFKVDSPLIYVDCSGNKVGIGKSSPAYELDILKSDNGSGAIFRVQANNTTAGIEIGYQDIRATGTNQNLILQSNGTGDVIINSTQGDKVGIGTASPGYKLDVEETLSGNYGFKLKNSHSNGDGLLLNAGSSSGNVTLDVQNYTGTSLMRVKGNGWVGFGTASPAVVVDINDDSVRVRTSQTPASSAACSTGEIAWDASYIYICTASTVWKRAALTGGY